MSRPHPRARRQSGESESDDDSEVRTIDSLRDSPTDRKEAVYSRRGPKRAVPPRHTRSLCSRLPYVTLRCVPLLRLSLAGSPFIHHPHEQGRAPSIASRAASRIALASDAMPAESSLKSRFGGDGVALDVRRGGSFPAPGVWIMDVDASRRIRLAAHESSCSLFSVCGGES